MFDTALGEGREITVHAGDRFQGHGGCALESPFVALLKQDWPTIRVMSCSFGEPPMATHLTKIRERALEVVGGRSGPGSK